MGLQSKWKSVCPMIDVWYDRVLAIVLLCVFDMCSMYVCLMCGMIACSRSDCCVYVRCVACSRARDLIAVCV